MGRTWGRLYSGTRNHRKIKILAQRHPVLWMAWYVLLEMAFEIDDDGWIYVSPNIPYSFKELAKELRIKRVDHLKNLCTDLEELGMIAVSDRGIQILSYLERNFETDSSTPRVQKYRKRQKDETLPERFCNGDETQTRNAPRTETETETEQKQNRTEVSAPLPTPDGSAAGSAAPKSRQKDSVFVCKHFEISQDYFDELVAEYPGLTPEMILAEIKKAADYATDNKGRFTRRANGQLKNPRLFLRNWFGKVIVPQQMPRSPTAFARTSRTERNIATAMAWAEQKEREMQTQEESWTPGTSRDSPQ